MKRIITIVAALSAIGLAAPAVAQDRYGNNNAYCQDDAISWIDWIERIPFFETKNYVARVIENAVVYENLYPEQTLYGRPRGVRHRLQRRQAEAFEVRRVNKTERS